MSPLGLTPHEQRVVSVMAQYANRADRLRASIGFNAAILGPLLVFACYGLAKRDLLAVGLAFFCLVAFLAWRVWYGQRFTRVLAAICQKVDAFESGGRVPAPPPAAPETPGPAVSPSPGAAEQS